MINDFKNISIDTWKVLIKKSSKTNRQILCHQIPFHQILCHLGNDEHHRNGEHRRNDENLQNKMENLMI